MKKLLTLIIFLTPLFFSNAHAHCPWNKPYHCVKSHGVKIGSVRVKVKVPILEIPNNPHSRRGAINAIKKNGRLLFKRGNNGVFHGNYCGLGGSANFSSAPVDAIDKACMQHDQCWAKKGSWNCACDKRLSKQAYRISSDPRQSQKVRGIALDVAAFFSITPCKPKLGRLFR